VKVSLTGAAGELFGLLTVYGESQSLSSFGGAAKR
jgi:hypothetical protein